MSLAVAIWTFTFHEKVDLESQLKKYMQSVLSQVVASNRNSDISTRLNSGNSVQKQWIWQFLQKIEGKWV